MKKIFLFCHLSPPVHGASLMGDNVFEILSDVANLDSHNLSISKSISDFNCGFIYKSYKSLINIFEAIKKIMVFSPDIIYFTPSLSGKAIYRDWFLSEIFRIMKIPVTIHVHMIPKKGFIYNFFIKRIFLKNNIILLSPCLVCDYKFNIDRLSNQVFFVSNYIKPLKLIESNRNNKVEFLYFGHLILSKGFFRVLNLINLLSNSYSSEQISFEFVGEFLDENTKNKCNKYIADNNLSDYITLSDPIFDFSQKSKIFSSKSALLAPSYSEALPLTYMEAASVGLPVFATDIGAVKELVNYQNGVLLPNIENNNDFMRFFLQKVTEYIDGKIKFDSKNIINGYYKNDYKSIFKNGIKKSLGV